MDISIDNNFSFYVHIFIHSFRKYLIFLLYSYECEGISLILVRTRILLYSLFLSPTAKANQVYLTSVLTYSYSFTS